MAEALIPGGFIVISRKIIESEIWDKPPLYMKVWMYLLLQAQHSDFKGLKRGQLSTSIPEIIEAISWKVGARRERPTRDQVFQIIDWMRQTKPERSPHESNAKATPKATMITTTKATQSLLVTIDNYWIYQDISNYESNDVGNDESNDEKSTKPSRKQRQPDNINKNVKNDKKKDIKHRHLDHVYLTEKEFAKLQVDLGTDFQRLMGELDAWLEKNPDMRNRDCNLTLRKWFKRNQEDRQASFSFSKRDPVIEARKIDIARAKWEQEGNDPRDFKYPTTGT